MRANSFSFGPYVWWMGVVEDRKGDPLKLGRIKVRVFGYHSKDLGDIATDQLMWAAILQPTNSAALSGIGTSPTGILEGSHVMGMFMDGEDAQVPLIIGTIAGIPKEKKTGEGFHDPNGVYPEYPLGESDVNRLARNEKISETIVQEKKDNLDTANVAFGGSWTEKATPYNAKYPFNHVRETESGHIQEFDDTEGSERYQLYHRKGTFVEIHPDGTEVQKIVKDKYTIVLGDDYVHIGGNCKVTISGDAFVLVEGNSKIETLGNCDEYIHGNYNLQVGGNYDVKVMGYHYDFSGIHRKITAPRIDLN